MSKTDVETWSIEGYDTFEGGPDAFYSVSKGHKTLEAAETAAREYLKEIEKSQPTETSGGQEEGGIQDLVFIVHPDGHKTRFRE